LNPYGQTAAEQALYQQANGIAQFVPANNCLLAEVADFKFSTDREALRNDLRLSQATRALALARVAQSQRLFDASNADRKDCALRRHIGWRVTPRGARSVLRGHHRCGQAQMHARVHQQQFTRHRARAVQQPQHRLGHVFGGAGALQGG
jgi:hypothetical protein